MAILLAIGCMVAAATALGEQKDDADSVTAMVAEVNRRCPDLDYVDKRAPSRLDGCFERWMQAECAAGAKELYLIRDMGEPAAEDVIRRELARAEQEYRICADFVRTVEQIAYWRRGGQPAPDAK